MDATPLPSPRAFITRATAGIGAEFARQLAASGHDLVLVARDEARVRERASEVRAEYGVAVEVLVADLVERADPVERADLVVVEARLVASGADRVTVLVNDAGFGLLKPFDDNPVDDEQQLLDLLVTAPMRLAHSVLGQMLGSGCGTIVNIASVVGYT